jgi:hypothetical protein
MEFLGAGRRKAQRKARQERAEIVRGKRLLAEGRAEEAEQLLAGLLWELERDYGREDRRAVAGRYAHAGALYAAGRAEEAADAFAVLIGDFRRMYGDGSVHLLSLALRQCQAMLCVGRYVEAEAVARGVAGQFDRPVYAHPRYLRVRYAVRLMAGQAVAARGLHAESLGHFDELASAAVRELGEDDVMTLSVRLFRVPQLHFLDRGTEADEEAAALVAATAPRGGRLAAGAAFTQVLVLGPAAGVPAAQQALAAYEGLHTPGNEHVHVCKARLAAGLGALGRHEEALAVLSSVPVAARAARPSWALARAEVLHAAGLPDAPDAAREAVDLCSAVWAPAHYSVLTARTLLAEVCGTPADRTGVADDWEAGFGAAHARTVAARKAATG